MVITRAEEVAMAAVAVFLLAMATFGVDARVFRPKRSARGGMPPPKRRVSYVIETRDDESEKGNRTDPRE
jgi:hypothetical protein